MPKMRVEFSMSNMGIECPAKFSKKVNLSSYQFHYRKQGSRFAKRRSEGVKRRFAFGFRMANAAFRCDERRGLRDTQGISA